MTRVLVLGRGDGRGAARGSGPAPGPAPGLASALGSDRAASVRELLLARACGWAAGAFGDGAVQVVAADAFAAALAHGAGGEPVLVVAPELPVWPAQLAADVAGDLEDGCALALGPIFDGGLYLLALADPGPDRAAALAAVDLGGPAAMVGLISLAQSEQWEVGLLRAERGLRRARDVRALLADPLTDPELRALLG